MRRHDVEALVHGSWVVHCFNSVGGNISFTVIDSCKPKEQNKSLVSKLCLLIPIIGGSYISLLIRKLCDKESIPLGVPSPRMMTFSLGGAVPSG